MGTRHVVLVCAFVGAFAMVFFLGAAERSAADIIGPVCADRPFCVSLEDQDTQSRSLESAHYMKYELTIGRDPDGGTSQLTNGRATLTLIDVIGQEDATPSDPTDPADVPSNAVFQEGPSDQRCSAGAGASRHIVTCTVPNLSAGAANVVYAPLIFTTTSRTQATSPFTKSLANVTFKERGSDNQPTDPNVDSVAVSNPTLYEALDDADRSLSFPTATITLATSATADEQHARFAFAVPNTLSTAFTAFVEETPVSQVAAGANPCGANTCYGEVVTTNTGGNGATLFSSQTPSNVVITWDFLPSGKTQNNIVVYHRLDNGTTEAITASCVRSGGAITNLPCRDVEIKRLRGGQVQVTISIFSAGNGGWGVG